MLTGIDQEYVEKTVCGILNTKQKDIIEYAGLFREFLERSIITAIGNADKIKKDGAIFDKLTEII